MYAPLDFRLVIVVLYPILERTSIFLLVPGWFLPRQNAAKPKPPSGIVFGGGFLWTKIMLSV
jgi:hypothetical protein